MRPADDAEAFRIGAVGGVGFPRPVAVEALVKLGGVVALGAEYSVFPKTNLAGVEVKSWALAADARVFPFKGGFFIGLRGGHQTFGASATKNTPTGALTVTADAQAWFVNPRLGFLWTWHNGFTLGFDAGVQVPIGSSLATTTPADAPASVNAKFAKVAGLFGNKVTPTIDLLRVGFLF